MRTRVRNRERTRSCSKATGVKRSVIVQFAAAPSTVLLQVFAVIEYPEPGNRRSSDGGAYGSVITDRDRLASVSIRSDASKILRRGRKREGRLRNISDSGQRNGCRVRSASQTLII